GIPQRGPQCRIDPVHDGARQAGRSPCSREDVEVAARDTLLPEGTQFRKYRRTLAAGDAERLQRAGGGKRLRAEGGAEGECDTARDEIRESRLLAAVRNVFQRDAVLPVQHL